MIAYGQPDAVSDLMACGRKVTLRTPQPGERVEQVRMTDGTIRPMTWVVDDQPVSRTQIEYAAARAVARRRAESLLPRSQRGK